MSRRRLLSRNPLLGTETYFHYHDENDSMTIETVTDVTGILEENKRDFNDAGKGWRGDMHKVASIPLPVYLDLKEKGIIPDTKAFKRWLNDPDNRGYRTRPGRV